MTINLNGDEFYSEQEVEERIREAIAGKDDKVNMDNLPIGTVVKVVDNRAGHCHEVGEILPITEVIEGNLDELYRLDGRCAGWVAIEDIEFVSFPEEEESTSGDGDAEADKDGGFEVGDKAEVISPYSMFNEGEEIVIVEQSGDGAPLARNVLGVEWFISVDKIKKIDEDESEKYPAVGTKVKAKRGTPWTTVGKVYEVLGITESSPHPISVTDDEDYDIYTLKMFEEFFEILKPLGQDANGVDLYEGDTITVTDQSSGESEEDTEIRAGDIVIATEDEFDITKGVEYEIKERDTGLLYFLDDDGDIRHVSTHEEILRKKPNKKVFKEGDIVVSTEHEYDITEGVEYEIREDEDGDLYFLDDVGDIRNVSAYEEIFLKKSSKRGFKKGDVVYVDVPFGRLKKGIAEVIDGTIYPDSFLEQGESATAFQNFGAIDRTVKITLVCRAEDRLDN